MFENIYSFIAIITLLFIAIFLNIKFDGDTIDLAISLVCCAILSRFLVAKPLR